MAFFMLQYIEIFKYIYKRSSSMTTITNPSFSQDVRTAVRDHYGKYAANAKSNTPKSCCGQNDTIPLSSVKEMYAASDVTTLPEDITGFSLGCGDPVTLASLQPGETVLDLGSGGGLDCFLAAKRVGENGKVIGVDMTAEMIEKARQNKEKIGAANVEFRLGEIEHLPAADNSVDVIISNCVINLSPDKPQVFRDAFRVLKPGGRLSVSDIVTEGELPEVIRRSLAAWAGCIAGALDIKEYITAIEAAGFNNVEITPVYWESTEIDAALVELDENHPGLKGSIKDTESLYRSIFSAKIKATKPI
jgi:arsenite methyltransferase